MPPIRVVRIAGPTEPTKVPSSLPRYADASGVLENKRELNENRIRYKIELIP